jgi:hypothetical protein
MGLDTQCPDFLVEVLDLDIPYFAVVLLIVVVVVVLFFSQHVPDDDGQFVGRSGDGRWPSFLVGDALEKVHQPSYPHKSPHLAEHSEMGASKTYQVSAGKTFGS